MKKQFFSIMMLLSLVATPVFASEKAYTNFVETLRFTDALQVWNDKAMMKDVLKQGESLIANGQGNEYVQGAVDHARKVLAGVSTESTPVEEAAAKNVGSVIKSAFNYVVAGIKNIPAVAQQGFENVRQMSPRAIFADTKTAVSQALDAAQEKPVATGLGAVAGGYAGYKVGSIGQDETSGLRRNIAKTATTLTGAGLGAVAGNILMDDQGAVAAAVAGGLGYGLYKAGQGMYSWLKGPKAQVVIQGVVCNKDNTVTITYSDKTKETVDKEIYEELLALEAEQQDKTENKLEVEKKPLLAIEWKKERKRKNDVVNPVCTDTIALPYSGNLEEYNAQQPSTLSKVFGWGAVAAPVAFMAYANKDAITQTVVNTSVESIKAGLSAFGSTIAETAEKAWNTRLPKVVAGFAGIAALQAGAKWAFASTPKEVVAMQKEAALDFINKYVLYQNEDEQIKMTTRLRVFHNSGRRTLLLTEDQIENALNDFHFVGYTTFTKQNKVSKVLTNQDVRVAAFEKLTEEYQKAIKKALIADYVFRHIDSNEEAQLFNETVLQPIRKQLMVLVS